jgi:hypothetical protein
MLLAPPSAHIPAFLRNKRADSGEYQERLDEMQVLRGQIYLEDGAIRPASLIDGRHESAFDSSSWHLLVLDEKDRICGCGRYHEHPENARSSSLNTARSALARDPQWKNALFSALRGEIALARSANIPFVELGGWALSEEIRGSAEALRVALATYAFWQMLGGAVCISTATRRHCSSSILRRIGGRSLEHDGAELPVYYDPQYSCDMEVLKFYSWSPNPRYSIWIEEMKSELSQISVLASHSEPQQIATPAPSEWRAPLLAQAKTA